MIEKLKNHYSMESLPSIYDEEAMTALQLAGRTAQKVNEVVDAMNKVPSHMVDLLDTYLEDGTLEEAVDRYAEAVGTSIHVLSTELNTRIDNLVGSMTEGSTTMDAEVIDGRLGTNADQYSTLGGHIRNIQDVFSMYATDPILFKAGFYDTLGHYSWNGSYSPERLMNTKAITVPYPIVVKATTPYKSGGAYPLTLSVCYWEETGPTNCENGPYGTVVGNPKTFDTGWREEICVSPNRPFTLSIRRLGYLEEEPRPGQGVDLHILDALRVKAEKPFFMDECYDNPLKPALKTLTHGGWNPTVEKYDLTLRNRMVTKPFWLDEPLKIKLNEDYVPEQLAWYDGEYYYAPSFALHTWKGTDYATPPNTQTWDVSTATSENMFSHDSGWQRELIIPAHEWCVLYFKDDMPDMYGEADFRMCKFLVVEKLTQPSMSEPVETVSTANTMFKSIAHRGYSAGAPENTLPAYTLAKRNGFDYVECDVRITSDDWFVLCHDETIDRTSNGTGRISDMTYEQLLEYDFGAWYGHQYEGTKIPTFIEFLTHCRRLGLHPYIEPKGTWSFDNISSLVEIIVSMGMSNDCTLISFENTHLETAINYLMGADPTSSMRFGALLTTPTSTSVSKFKSSMTAWSRTMGAGFFLDVGTVPTEDEIYDLQDALMSAVGSKPVGIEVYTINDEDTLESLPGVVSGVTSDKIHAGKYYANLYL